VPSTTVFGHGLLHPLWLWLVLFRHHHPPSRRMCVPADAPKPTHKLDANASSLGVAFARHYSAWASTIQPTLREFLANAAPTCATVRSLSGLESRLPQGSHFAARVWRS
jgi:hypothetical protein